MRLEIEKETERTCVNKSVSPKPIQLTVYSPQVPNLTLVDMPGLTKIPVGDQPASITQDIEDMARMYIEGDNAIVRPSSHVHPMIHVPGTLGLRLLFQPGANTHGCMHCGDTSLPTDVHDCDNCDRRFRFQRFKRNVTFV